MKIMLHPILLRSFSLFLLLVNPFLLLAQQWDTLATIPANFTFPVVDVLNGKIHVMGGGGDNGATDLHYAYDPATNTWEQKANLPYVAQQPAGAAANGKIHFFGGGFPNSGSPLDDHYGYDPATDSWEQAADLTAPRAIHYAVTLDNELYSLAGQGMTNLCQTYDPSSDVWITKNNLPDGVFFYGAHVAAEGHIYRFCGGGYAAPNNKAHRYDPDTDSWAVLPSFPVANHGITGTSIGDKIYLAGGYHDFLERDEVYIYDTQTETYEMGIPLPLGRNYHNMVAVDSCIYVVGGHHAIDETVRTQLLRLCPFESPSTVGEGFVAGQMNAYYFSGNITLDIPESVVGAKSEFSLFDLVGRKLSFEKINKLNRQHKISADWLPSGIYVVHMQIGNSFLSTKVSVY